MDLTVVPRNAAVLVIGMILLSARVIRLRRRYAVSVGDGWHASLQQAIRVHGNFCEYVPLSALLLLAGRGVTMGWSG